MYFNLRGFTTLIFIVYSIFVLLYFPDSYILIIVLYVLCIAPRGYLKNFILCG